jgi:hypothetical protein
MPRHRPKRLFTRPSTAPRTWAMRAIMASSPATSSSLRIPLDYRFA